MTFMRSTSASVNLTVGWSRRIDALLKGIGATGLVGVVSILDFKLGVALVEQFIASSFRNLEKSKGWKLLFVVIVDGARVVEG